MLGIIKRNFRDLPREEFAMLFKSMVRSHLEYAQSVWPPYKIKDTEAIERVQMRATKLIFKNKHISYEERLKVLGLPTLKYRRIIGNMIEVYKIVHNLSDTLTSVQFPFDNKSLTRGHSYKIVVRQVRLDLRKYNFSNRIVSIWNSLPDSVVDAVSLNSFKGALDRFWRDQEVVYVWKEEITGTGSRSFLF